MTNKEILQAGLLDILFEHRNKACAYARRKTYNHRLQWALGKMPKWYHYAEWK